MQPKALLRLTDPGPTAFGAVLCGRRTCCQRGYRCGPACPPDHSRRVSGDILRTLGISGRLRCHAIPMHTRRNRAILAGSVWSSREDSDELEGAALLMGLLSQTECRAAILLARHGIDAAAVRQRWPDLAEREVFPAGAVSPIAGIDMVSETPPLRLSVEVELSLQIACHRLADCHTPLELATEHLLLGLAGGDHEVADWLRSRGLDPDALQAEIERWYGYDRGLPLDMPAEPGVAASSQCEGYDYNSSTDVSREKTDGSHVLEPPLASGFSPCPTAEWIGILRVLDAAANRAGEGLRVVEDYVRFVLDDRHLTSLCKQLRHDLTAVLGHVLKRPSAGRPGNDRRRGHAFDHRFGTASRQPGQRPDGQSGAAATVAAESGGVRQTHRRPPGRRVRATPLSQLHAATGHRDHAIQSRATRAMPGSTC